ncbi:MAG: hypothetical protein A3K67_00120 [Euryarchaeota archaeon RBG_16_62_10]|nr:MAG: hypothetical protein A3K67_00120 [Euryarchaeota archaeon RBG_16_62_10]
MRRAKAFCPGHVTGFFEICPSDDLLSMGSRGAGMCLTLGATSEVTVTDGPRQKVEVSINGRKSGAEVTKAALRGLIGKDRKEVLVSTVLDLPMSQGFGMSAAGALSASLALCDVLGRTRQEAFEAAHVAEIECGSGLGDVSAIHRGGITVRVRPGLPPRGEVLRIEGEPEVVLCVIGRPILTKTVLGDPAKARAINSRGAAMLERLIREPALNKLMELSAGFAAETGLASSKMKRAIEDASEHGMASMSMLGNSAFAVGDAHRLRRALESHGKTWTCRVDLREPAVSCRA